MSSPRRTRAPIACQRCKRRKTKCNGGLPVCSACERSGSHCAWPSSSPANMAYPAERSHLLQHTSRLERQVAELQARLKASESSSSHDPVTSHHGELSSDVVLLSLNAAAEPSFVGATSGLSLSRLVEGILAESRPTDHPAPEDAAWGAGTAAGPLVDAEEMLLDTFFNRVHPRYPFLAQRSFQQPEDDQDASYLFQRDMVCAIGARLVQLHPELYRSASPEVYFSRAMLQVDKALAQQSLQRVQALLLIATYLLRTPTNLSSIGSWHLIGLAVRHAVELGLHRNLRGARARQLSAEDMEIRHRVFWSAYLLDRAVSLTLGRPFALADHDIDVPIPDTEDFVSFTHMCRLRHLESRIHREVFDTNLPSAHDDETIERFRHELEAWRLGVWASLDSQTDGPNYSLYDTREFFEIQYSKALRMLLQPRITGDRGDSSQTAFYLSLSARAAGDVCQCYKTLHQRRRLGWNLLALHSIFTAGLTLLYCAWARREQVPDLAALEDIRACSNVLFAISEQWPSTQRFRDAFETLARRMMEIVSTSHPAASTQGLSAVEMAPNDDNFWSIFDDLVDDEFIRNQFWFDNTC